MGIHTCVTLNLTNYNEKVTEFTHSPRNSRIERFWRCKKVNNQVPPKRFSLLFFIKLFFYIFYCLKYLFEVEYMHRLAFEKGEYYIYVKHYLTLFIF